MGTSGKYQRLPNWKFMFTNGCFILKKTTLYTLNTESLIVKALKKIQHEIMFYDADKIAREQTEMRIEIITEKGKIKAEV